MRLRRLSDDVFVADAPIVRLGQTELDLVRRQAAASPRKRARICAHHENSEAVHEMLIAMAADSYIHPHKHLDKGESFHVVEGQVDVVVLDDDGQVSDVIEMGEIDSGRSFFYRFSDRRYHTLLIRTDMLVVHEVTRGPFDPEATLLAPFAPPEHDRERAAGYMRGLAGRAADWRRARLPR